MVTPNPNPILQSAVANAMALPPTSGYTALGYAGVDNFVWSHARDCVVPLSANQLSSAATLMATCGSQWCEYYYPKYNDKDEVVGFLVQKLAAAIITDCQQVGVYNADKIRGSGVWNSESGIVINGSSVWSPTITEAITRSGFEGHIYPTARDIGLEPGGLIATPEDLAELDDMLSAYEWGHTSDPMLLSGWLTVAVLSGALLRRPHLCLTGPRAVGKSACETVVGAIAGDMGVFGDAQSTPAGIKQKMRSDAGPVILDEGEPEGGASNILRLVKMARSTYSDDTSDGILQGTSSGNYRSFSMRLSFFLVAIAPPAFEAADATRWVVTEIKALKKEAQLSPSKLITEPGRAARLGKKVKALIVSRFEIFTEALALFRTAIMSGSAQARQADTIGTLIAGWWILHNTVAPTAEQAKVIIEGLDTATHAEAHSSSDESDCLAAILRAVLRDGQDSLTVAEAIDKVTTEGSKCRWHVVLGHAGLKVVGTRLHIATSDDHLGVKTLLRDTKFQHGGWARILKRLPDSEHNKSSYLAGMTQKVVSVIYPTREVVGAGEVVDLFDNTVRKIG